MPSNPSLAALGQDVNAELNRQLASVTPALSMIGRRRDAAPGVQSVTVVTRDRLASLSDTNDVLYAATGGMKPYEDGTGPKVVLEPSGRGATGSQYHRDEYHYRSHSQFVDDIVRAVAVDPDRVGIAALERANSDTVVYTIGDGSSKTSALFAPTGNPWFTYTGASVSNVVSLSLSAPAISAARSRMAIWPNWKDGVVNGVPRGAGLMLWVHPDNVDLARTITGSPSFPISVVGLGGGSAITGDVMNALMQHNIVVIEVPELTVNTASYLISPAAQPLEYVTFTPPRVVIQETAQPQKYVVSAYHEMKATLAPFEGGAIRIAE